MESRDVGLPIDGHIFTKICIPAGHIIFIVMFHSFYGYFLCIPMFLGQWFGVLCVGNLPPLSLALHCLGSWANDPLICVTSDSSFLFH